MLLSNQSVPDEVFISLQKDMLDKLAGEEGREELYTRCSGFVTNSAVSFDNSLLDLPQTQSKTSIES